MVEKLGDKRKREKKPHDLNCSAEGLFRQKSMFPFVSRGQKSSAQSPTPVPLSSHPSSHPPSTCTPDREASITGVTMGIRVIEKCTVVRGLICPEEGTRTRSGGWVRGREGGGGEDDVDWV